MLPSIGAPVSNMPPPVGQSPTGGGGDVDASAAPGSFLGFLDGLSESGAIDASGEATAPLPPELAEGADTGEEAIDPPGEEHPSIASAGAELVTPTPTPGLSAAGPVLVPTVGDPRSGPGEAGAAPFDPDPSVPRGEGEPEVELAPRMVLKNAGRVVVQQLRRLIGQSARTAESGDPLSSDGTEVGKAGSPLSPSTTAATAAAPSADVAAPDAASTRLSPGMLPQPAAGSSVPATLPAMAAPATSDTEAAPAAAVRIAPSLEHQSGVGVASPHARPPVGEVAQSERTGPAITLPSGEATLGVQPVEAGRLGASEDGAEGTPNLPNGGPNRKTSGVPDGGPPQAGGSQSQGTAGAPDPKTHLGGVHVGDASVRPGANESAAAADVGPPPIRPALDLAAARGMARDLIQAALSQPGSQVTSQPAAPVPAPPSRAVVPTPPDKASETAMQAVQGAGSSFADAVRQSEWYARAATSEPSSSDLSIAAERATSDAGPGGSPPDHAQPHQGSGFGRLLSSPQSPVSGPPSTFATLASAAAPPAISPAFEHLVESADLPQQIVRGMRLQWRDGMGEARLRLQPEQLGEVTVTLKIDRGTVSATLRADNPETRAWIQAHESTLRASLAEQGLDLDRLSVSDAPERRRGRQSPEQGRPQERRRRSDDASAARFEVEA